MNIQICSCKNCGSFLKILEGQFVTQCNYCKSRYYIEQDSPKAVVLKPEIEIKVAKNLILNGLHHKFVSRNFLKNSFYEKATLYYFPFFEVRGIKAGWDNMPANEIREYTYHAFDFLQKANDLNNLKIGLFDYSAVEESILKAQQIPFDPVEMRKSGVILSPKELEFLKKNHFQQSADVVEIHYRIVYFPVWEIAYTYKGIIFKSYLSAVDGKILKIHALKNHQLKLFFAIGGLFGLATILSRSLKVAFIMLKTPLFGFFLFFLVIGFPFLLFITALLFPYLWRLFAFREELIMRGKLVESYPINYTENNIIRISRILGEKFTRFFDFKKVE